MTHLIKISINPFSDEHRVVYKERDRHKSKEETQEFRGRWAKGKLSISYKIII